jgi:hypothetical protein
MNDLLLRRTLTDGDAAHFHFVHEAGEGLKSQSQKTDYKILVFLHFIQQNGIEIELY